MNRLFITILSFCFLANIYAQKPTKGSFATEAQMNLNVNNGNTGFFSLEDNMLLPTLRFRYFLSSSLALRADLNVMSSSATDNFFENADGSGATGEFISKENMYGLGLGVEKHFGGNAKFSPFVGGGFNFGIGSNTTEANNAAQAGGITAFAADTKSESENKTSAFGVGAFLGADYWINNSFYVGGQLGYGFNSTTVKDGSYDETVAGVAAPTAVNAGGKFSGFGSGITPSIRVGFLFNGKSGPADSDNDGIADDLDKCPNTPKGEKVSSEGCPIFINEIRMLAKNIYFETASDKLKASSNESLDKVAAILISHPDANLSIEGHTDSQGDDAANLDLSKRRAMSVMNYLASKGVDGKHLQATGFGETKPVADNSTKEGRALNRRVELLVSY